MQLLASKRQKKELSGMKWAPNIMQCSNVRTKSLLKLPLLGILLIKRKCYGKLDKHRGEQVSREEQRTFDIGIREGSGNYHWNRIEKGKNRLRTIPGVGQYSIDKGIHQ